MLTCARECRGTYVRRCYVGCIVEQGEIDRVAKWCPIYFGNSVQNVLKTSITACTLSRTLSSIKKGLLKLQQFRPNIINIPRTEKKKLRLGLNGSVIKRFANNLLHFELN